MKRAIFPHLRSFSGGKIALSLPLLLSVAKDEKLFSKFDSGCPLLPFSVSTERIIRLYLSKSPKIEKCNKSHDLFTKFQR